MTLLNRKVSGPHHVYYFQNQMKFRMCTDYRKVNNCTSKTDSFPIPRTDDCMNKIGRSKFVSKFDLLKGFWKIPLTKKRM